MPVHFIPHQIQRQLPNQRPSSQATFVPATMNSHAPNHMVHQMNIGGQQHTVNYTVTSMQLPSVVHSIPSTSGQTSSTKPKSKNQEKGLFICAIVLYLYIFFVTLNFIYSTGKKQKKLLRIAGGQVWEDPTLTEWDPNDFRIFCGDLGNDVTDEVLARAFNKFNTFVKAKVVRDKRSSKSRGYGFVSFKDPQEFARAIKEMNGRCTRFYFYFFSIVL